MSSTALERRRRQWNAAASGVFDVAVIGGGISGACLYHHLCARGFSVLLLDKGDFGSGTSQASAMMVWGGLLYLRNWDLLTVMRLCNSRDRMVAELEGQVRTTRCRFFPSFCGTEFPAGRKTGWRARPTVLWAGLQLYWLLGSRRRLRPRWDEAGLECAFLEPRYQARSLLYEEACVDPSDARFVLRWILPYQNDGQVALNYCSVDGGDFHGQRGLWSLRLGDAVLGESRWALARWVVNAGGVWTDSINESFAIKSPLRHVISKGVFLSLRRDERHQSPLMFETSDHRDVMALIPWGPVALWGPTDTIVSTPEEGYEVLPEDLRLLLGELNQHLKDRVTPDDVVSVRCGARALATDRKKRRVQDSSLALSRRYQVRRDDRLPWLSVYGGKLTDCVSLARRIVKLMCSVLGPPTVGPTCESVDRQAGKPVPRPCVPSHVLGSFPGMPADVPTPEWCADQEMCWTLEDYLRRRTNISQWVARGGLGNGDVNLHPILRLAQVFSKDGEAAARLVVEAYRKQVVRGIDLPLAQY